MDRPNMLLPGAFVAHIAEFARVAVLLCLYAAPSAAVEVSELEVFENGGTYHVNMKGMIDAPADYVLGVLTDYVHIYHLSPSIVESRVLSTDGNGTTRVRTRISDCILIFCMELDRIEDVYESPSRHLHATIVPTLGNLRSGSTEWEIEPRGEHSLIIYESELEPDFAIFPLIGPALVKSKMRGEVLRSLLTTTAR